ncbi:gamma-mobile-trio recombinase GmtY [Pseudomonas sp. 35 E 8]|uniref:gamma-mobile-trio recombinase GmtY n=1 Tax=Pseudomonas sp. 35 E 8 TaxID=1844103 RepID=UPI0008126EE1|nr:gamma-mobile-trio recombinase GmtY [Pseudomonas sp. 35 E 8]CRM19721.1 Site-specific recombinase XerD [Pseudomonas sp. 35 E 8]
MSVAYIKVMYRSNTTGHGGKAIQGLLTKHGVLVSLLQYHAETGSSSSGQAATNRSVKLLVEFTEQSDIPFSSAVDLMKAFRFALDHGTVDWKGEDPTELLWRPRSKKQVNRIIGYLTNYTDWLILQPGHSGVIINPIREANNHEQKLNWCAYHHKKNSSLLKHLKSKSALEQTKYTREIGRLSEDTILLEEVMRFPESRFNDLIEKGFINPKIANPNSLPYLDYKSQAMTYLMHYGGIRESELFHIFLSDIGIDINRNEAVIKIYHPSEGKSPERGFSNREDYLKRKYGIKPRTAYLKTESLHAGWKNPLLDHTDNYMRISFFPPSKAVEFLAIFQLYLKYQRVEPRKNSHPYAFTNIYGEPETKKNFRRRHEAAVRRIGLTPSKLMGTTEHGHRHAYGYRLSEHDFKVVEIQKMMHHKSPSSCLVYISKTGEETREIMRQTERKNLDSAPPAPKFLKIEGNQE